ncbi:uncharacterized protein GLRG_09034 [Colletotrichum graminicola M1.001]|uniref:Uncharacterized protein n=1 Tax=Colletotrichum graminicola (strain M1.001 / M2 / FGSC 10212) TaxID=645133 RepID=E3QSQ2_COLGM|nr:uncharacterized protein GLRG_09034 [Colletotrichum graminicola M1.001]EFQ33890.1 hypothetical protein GLRG_09034 [Colletotrichum graminicola M1.001]
MADAAVTVGRTGDYVLISKPKKGIAYVEARFKEDKIPSHTDRGCQLLLSRLEQEWIHKGVPGDMFHSLRVVEFQGLDPTTRVVSIRDVAIKVNLYGRTPESPSSSDDEIVTMLPNSTLDGLWELLVIDHAVQPQLFYLMHSLGEAGPR